MKNIVIVAAAASLAALATIPVRADDTADRLAACKAIDSDSERLACYDELAGSSTPATTAEPAPAPAAAPQPLTDDVAKREIKGTPVERPEYSAVVTRCEELKHERRMFFFMENGQIWQQSNSGRLNFRAKECQFDVTIRKDAFGWILYVPSEKERVRVRRIR